MLNLLKQLCLIDATAGDEVTVREFIINEIKDFCEYKVDNLGNIICFKKGQKTPTRKVMLEAHMDEGGLIITSVTENGFLKFNTHPIPDWSYFEEGPVKVDPKIACLYYSADFKYNINEINSYLEKGYYVSNRVFFKDEETAIEAGYRPCAICMPNEYKVWKVNQEKLLSLNID